MKRLTPMTLILLVLTLSMAAIVFTVAPAPGQTTATVQQWEYKVLDTRDLLIHPQLTEALVSEMKSAGTTAATCLESPFDKLGTEGWELVSYADRVAVFKRPKK